MREDAKTSKAQSSVLEPDVLVAGAGIAGCALASALAKRGLDVLLVERAPQPRRTFKGEYLQPAAVEYLESIGFGSVFDSPSSEEITHLRFRDLDEDARERSFIVMHYPDGKPARSIELFDLLSGLTERARDCLGDRFWQGTELRPASRDAGDFASRPEFICSTDGRETTVRPRWTIGCDGRGSALRKWIGGPVAAKNGRVTLGAKEEFILGAHVQGKCDLPSRYEVIRLEGHGTISVFSLGAAGKRIYLSARPPGKSDGSFAEAFRRALEAAGDATGLSEIPEELQVTGYPANAEWFGPPSNGRVFLAGDALAVTTPYGGQGMTIALEHARFLSQEIDWSSDAAVQEAKAKYARFAADVHDRASLLNFGLYYAFFSRPPIFRHSTQLILRSWEKNPALKSRVTRLFGGLDRDTPTLLEILDLERRPFGSSASRLIERAFRWA